MWSPKANANGAQPVLREHAPGRSRRHRLLVLRHENQGGGSRDGRRPDRAEAGFRRRRFELVKEGWFVPVYYCGFESPLRPKDHIAILRHFLPARYSPLQVNGDGLQSVYLAEVPGPMADALIGLIGQPYYEALAELTAFPSGPDVEEIDDSEVDSDLGPTFKEQLVKARRGQGVFRSSVLLSETECRVTGVSDAKHLRASHIKPWRDANNSERLNGSNGLLLSPHIDHLFDQGYIIFPALVFWQPPWWVGQPSWGWGFWSGGGFSREQAFSTNFTRPNVPSWLTPLGRFFFFFIFWVGGYF